MKLLNRLFKKKNNKIKIKSFICKKNYNGWKIPKVEL